MEPFPDDQKPSLRIWALKAMEPLTQAVREDDPKSMILGLAASLLYGVSGVFEHAPHDAKDGTANYFDDVSESFNNDLCLFEVFCYISFRLDAWIFTKGYSHFRQVFNSEVINCCLDIFSHLIGDRDLSSILDSRLDAYSRTFRAGQTSGRELHFLEQYIVRTIYEKKLRAYDITNEPIVISGAYVTAMIQIHMMAWITASLETHIDLLKFVVKAMIKSGYISDKMEE